MCPHTEDEIALQNAGSEIPTAIATKDARNRQINSCRIDKEEEMEWKVETEKAVELHNLLILESYHQNENGNGRGKEKEVNGVDAKKRVTRLKPTLAIIAVNRNEVLKKESGGKEMPKRMSCIKE